MGFWGKLLNWLTGKSNKPSVAPEGQPKPPTQVVVPTKAITKDLEGKQKRKLQMELRLLIEAYVFPNGVVPKHWKDYNLEKMVLDVCVALNSFGIKEIGSNKGHHVGLIQGTVGGYVPGGDGAAWCMSTDQTIIAFIEDYCQIESPVKAGELCTDVYAAAAKVQGLTTQSPTVGSFFSGRHGTTIKGHTGAVVELVWKAGKMLLNTFEGNVDNRAKYMFDRHPKQTGNFKVEGFIFVYPNNIVPVKALF